VVVISPVSQRGVTFPRVEARTLDPYIGKKERVQVYTTPRPKALVQRLVPKAGMTIALEDPRRPVDDPGTGDDGKRAVFQRPLSTRAALGCDVTQPS
jgi:hypothetical protein